MTIADLKAAMARHNVTPGALIEILEIYAEITEREAPYATAEIEAASHIGLNIKDMLEEAE